MDQYAVMGNPIKHSKSPLIHREFAHQTNQELNYQALLVAEDGFVNAVSEFKQAGGRGLNITVPFKQQAHDLVEELSERARRAKAVNTIIIKSDGSLKGENTDGVGLVRDIINNHDGRLANSTVLLVGAGGAVRGVLEPILKENPIKIVIANRTFEKAHHLAEEFSDLGKVEALPFSKLGNESFDWIINGTSASLQGDLPPLHSGILNQYTRCYDMMYGQDMTPFNQWALENGAAAAFDGLGMLVEQAAESFRLWRGVMPLTGPVIKKLRK